MAPDPFRVGRADGKRKRLADGLDRHGRFHRLVGDLDPLDVVLVIEIHFGAVVNRAFAPTDFYNYPLLSADHEVGQERPGSRYTAALLAADGRKGVVGAYDRGVRAVDSGLHLATRAPDRGPVDYPAVALRRYAVPVEGGEERDLGVGLADPEFRTGAAKRATMLCSPARIQIKRFVAHPLSTQLPLSSRAVHLGRRC